MQTDTPESLMEAVGYEWRTQYGRVQCPECKCTKYAGEGENWHRFNCRRPDTSHIEPTYTGPALGTPELDAIFLVEGQRWCVENWHKYDDVNDAIHDSNLQAINETDTFVLEWLLFYCPTPGHALARAIREAKV
jgi:hypothetical protein